MSNKKIALSYTIYYLLYMNNFKRFLAIFLVLTLCAGFAFSADIKQGNIAPDFSIQLLDGTTVKLSEITKSGKAVLLHFWATWCPPCIRELPSMNKLSQNIKNEGKNSKIAFLGISVSDTKKDCVNFIKKNDYSFPCGVDETGTIASLYGIQGIPASILISPNGKIEKIHVSMMTPQMIADFVKDYIQ